MKLFLFRLRWLTRAPWFILSACLSVPGLALLQDNCLDLLMLCCAFLSKLSGCVKNITAFCQHLCLGWYRYIGKTQISANYIGLSLVSMEDTFNAAKTFDWAICGLRVGHSCFKCWTSSIDSWFYLLKIANTSSVESSSLLCCTIECLPPFKTLTFSAVGNGFGIATLWGFCSQSESNGVCDCKNVSFAVLLTHRPKRLNFS